MGSLEKFLTSVPISPFSPSQVMIAVVPKMLSGPQWRITAEKVNAMRGNIFVLNIAMFSKKL